MKWKLVKLSIKYLFSLQQHKIMFYLTKCKDQKTNVHYVMRSRTSQGGKTLNDSVQKTRESKKVLKFHS